MSLNWQDGKTGWHHLGGPLLCFTGTEALYVSSSSCSDDSNLPQSRLILAPSHAALCSSLGCVSCYLVCCKVIRLETLVCLILELRFAYIGQAAFIMHDPTAWSNPFFNSAPSLHSSRPPLHQLTYHCRWLALALSNPSDTCSHCWSVGGILQRLRC